MITTLKPVYDQLSVKDDKATEDQKAQPQLDLSSGVGRERGGMGWGGEGTSGLVEVEL